MKQYYYLALESGRFEIIVAQADTDRVGLLGANFSTATQAAEYAALLNDEARAHQDELDKQAEGS